MGIKKKGGRGQQSGFSMRKQWPHPPHKQSDADRSGNRRNKRRQSDREIYLRTSEREESLSSDLEGRTAAGLGEDGRSQLQRRGGDFFFLFPKGKKESLSENRQQIGGRAGGEERKELTGKHM